MAVGIHTPAITSLPKSRFRNRTLSLRQRNSRFQKEHLTLHWSRISDRTVALSIAQVARRYYRFSLLQRFLLFPGYI